MANRQTAGTRARDTDRNDTCQILDSALADGQLSMEEHRTRVALATQAETLGDLQSLISDLQTSNAPVQLPDLKRRPTLSGAGGGWGIRLAVAGVLVVLGIAIGWGLYGNTTSPVDFTSDPGAKSDGIPARVLTAPKQLQSLGGLNGLIEQMKQKFGDTEGYRLVVYPEYASLDRPDPNDERRKLSYTYRGGWGDPSSSAKSDGDRMVDLSKFDAKEIVAVFRGAPETLGAKPADVTSTYLIFEPSSDETAPPGALDVTIYVSTDFGSGYIELNGDGTTKQINYVD
ncbi:hypothetical protein BST36_11610 [Mycolicibacterium moriokaense]|uniref:DUF1707 domain-containing protein n=1 Tax=Mycolicibacterium moriokaense TaxID=39691 RepID=A0AAD1H5U1_9MYCO|nr:DUF1707 domain-containing protein [Mycolicibacterium moriokaense]MCV7037581.1 DUF1707 domain-containing protein [Mycolicibacterium moriokaense]ORB23638.1 hypothetical protein BST36_11610 [Mycolicibacterium moriokaense]BBW99481.1 hypothetical protein MMOR_04180 [Mycolicibacterium moriokaense]